MTHACDYMNVVEAAKILTQPPVLVKNLTAKPASSPLPYNLHARPHNFYAPDNLNFTAPS